MTPSLPRLVAVTVRRVWLPALFVPPLVAGVLAWLVVRELVMPDYATNEWLGVAIPAVTVLVAFLRAWTSGAPFFLWLTGLAANFLTREIHFEGTSTTVYIGLGVLLLVAWRWYGRLEPYLASRLVTTLLTCTFLTYTMAITLDQGWWKFIPYEPIFDTPVEESLEVLGHLFLLAVCFVPTRTDRFTEERNAAAQPRA